jgi:hypothetical protein
MEILVPAPAEKHERKWKKCGFLAATTHALPRQPDRGDYTMQLWLTGIGSPAAQGNGKCPNLNKSEPKWGYQR